MSHYGRITPSPLHFSCHCFRPRMPPFSVCPGTGSGCSHAVMTLRASGSGYAAVPSGTNVNKPKER